LQPGEAPIGLLAKKIAGDLALFHQMIGDIYSEEKQKIYGDLMYVKCWYTILVMVDEKSGFRIVPYSSPLFFEDHLILVEAM
jgi:hypothetical protein